jgi:hypothetical protein
MKPVTILQPDSKMGTYLNVMMAPSRAVTPKTLLEVVIASYKAATSKVTAKVMMPSPEGTIANSTPKVTIPRPLSLKPRQCGLTLKNDPTNSPQPRNTGKWEQLGGMGGLYKKTVLELGSWIRASEQGMEEPHKESL